MTSEDWAKLQKAYNYLMNSDDAKIENPKWIIYKVGSNVVRIDIKNVSS